MKTQKIINLLNNSENESSNFAIKKRYVIDSESKKNYSHHDPTKFLAKSLEFVIILMHYCDYYCANK